MGSFEKLGILVIVVIIVMILAVAIYQWGGAEGPNELRTAFDGGAPSMIVKTGEPAAAGPRNVDYIDRKAEEERKRREAELADPTPSADSWPGGIPKSYVIRDGDVVWNLVVKTWRLRESFIGAIVRANPDVNMKRLRLGQPIRIPNPDAYRSGAKSRSAASSKGEPSSRRAPRGARYVEVQEGDSISSIAYEQLGKASRAGEIIELNPGVKPKSLKPGDRLLIPAR